MNQEGQEPIFITHHMDKINKLEPIDPTKPDPRDSELSNLRQKIALHEASYLELEGKMKQVEADNVRLNQCVQEAKGEITSLNSIIGSLDVDDPKATDALLKTLTMQRERMKELSSWAESVVTALGLVRQNRGREGLHHWTDNLLNSLPKWMKEGK